jgi:hypothetical protein
LAELPSELEITDELSEERSQPTLVAAHQCRERVILAIEGELNQLLV